MVDLQNLRNSVKSFQDISKKQTKLFDDIEHLTEQLTSINSGDVSALGNIEAGLREHLDSLRKLSDQHTSKVNDLSNSIDSIDGTQKELSLRKDADSFLKSNSYTWIIEDVTENVKKSELWSPEFYSSPLGYHLRCKFVFGDEHVGVHIQFVEGLYDYVLEWPCPQQIQVTLVNQVDKDGDIECILKSGNNDDSEPWSRHFKCILKADDVDNLEPWARPKKGKTQQPTVGKDVFIEKSKLSGSKGDYKSCFVRNNRIYLIIHCMPEKGVPVYSGLFSGLFSGRKSTESSSSGLLRTGSLRSDINELLQDNVFIFAQEGFNRDRLHGRSNPFYTSVYGYKLQLQFGSNEEWFGVFIALLSGEFDYLLEWPFNKNVKFSVVNQVDQMKNIVCILKPDQSNPKEEGRWIKQGTGKNESRGGFGFPNFIELNELFGGDDGVSQILRNERVLIKVEFV